MDEIGNFFGALPRLEDYQGKTDDELKEIVNSSVTQMSNIENLANGILSREGVNNMTFNLSNLYETKTVAIGAYSVTVREVPHGEFARFQSDMIQNMELDVMSGRRGMSRQMQQAIRSGQFMPADFSDKQILLAIESWTIEDANGNVLPVTLEAYRAIPHKLAEAIERAVESLNPTLDDEFQG